MSLLNNTDKVYSRSDLSVFDFLDHPIWIFDILNKSFYWANTSAVKYWNANSLEELLARDCSHDMSEAVHKKNLDILERLKRKQRVEESVTYYPNGAEAKTMRLKLHGMQIGKKGNVCQLTEAFPIDLSNIDPAFIRSSATLQYLPMAVCQYDEYGKLTYQNPEARHTFGTPEEDYSTFNSSVSTGGVLNNNDDDALKQIHNNHFVNRFVDRQIGSKIHNQIKRGQDVNVEALLYTKCGPEWHAIHTRLGKDSITAEPIILFSSRDISEILSAKRELQVNKERNEFFAIMAHEIRTPLFQVTGFIDLLDQTNLTTEQEGYVKLLKASSAGLMNVINDVLDFSKLEDGRMKLDITPFEPRQVVDGTLAAVAASIKGKGLTLNKSFPSKIPVKLMGDPNRLRQILLNLVNNAVKFTHRGTVDVDVEIVKEENSPENRKKENSPRDCILLRFSVRDTGIGIDAKHLSNIFKKYNQAAASISTTYGGTGLGLTICDRLVTSMNGEIGVESALGEGSKFWFIIPFSCPIVESRTPVEPEKFCEMPASAELRILVAEDNKVNQKLISKMLSRLNHTSKIVVNGLEAVREVQEHAYDLVLMDIQMPIMDGIDATKEIRSKGMTTPIIGLTASVYRTDFMDLGLDGWICKPVRLGDLQKTIGLVMSSTRRASLR
mmetsp:Transcript_26899/g.39791  ORF Transcript_26899/g.39791 Transcript_26899/m.39791 type:complete len:666 (-) Transcript_26899:35-2032(-)